MQRGNIFVVTAPSGAGKTTLVAALLAADPLIRLSVSYTTRAPREGEVDGKHYHFVRREDFLLRLQQGEFLESAEVYGNFYGASQRWLQQQLDAGNDILLEIDWQGAQQVRALFPDAIGIFILPPSLEVLEQRLRSRAKDSEESIVRRMASAREEINHVEAFDYVIVNEFVDEAVKDLVSVVRSQRVRIGAQSLRHVALLAALRGN